MTKLIPLDAAIAAVNLAIWKSPIKAQISTIDASNDTAEALRAIPTIDPAAIREAVLIEAADAAINIDGIGPSKMPQRWRDAILALIGEKK